MQKQFDTLPTGLPEWDGTGIDDFDLPDYMFKDPIHYSEEWFAFIEEKVKDENLADEYKQIMINIMHKRHGVDVRLSLTIFVYIIAHGFTITLNEFKDLTEKIINKMSELELGYQNLIDEWKITLAGVTEDDEVINARIELRGFVNKTLKERLDRMQTIDDKLNPVSEVFSIEHNQFCYPIVRVLSLEYGLGVVPLESEPVFGGSSTVTINCDVEYVDRNTLKVKIPLAYGMTNPTIERISANEYLLVEGVKSLIIEVGTKEAANVETFIMREIQSDFNTPPKISNSVLENKNDFRYGLSAATSIQLPTATWGEGEQIHMDGIKKLDGTSANLTRLGNGSIGQWLIKFNALWILEQNFPLIFTNASTISEKVAIAKKLITKFQYEVWAKASGPANTLCSHSLYNPSSSSWGASATSSGASTTQRIITSNNASTPAYLTSDGFYCFVTYAGASNGTIASSVSIDYTSITITARVPFAKI